MAAVEVKGCPMHCKTPCLLLVLLLFSLLTPACSDDHSSDAGSGGSPAPEAASALSVATPQATQDEVMGRWMLKLMARVMISN